MTPHKRAKNYAEEVIGTTRGVQQLDVLYMNLIFLKSKIGNGLRRCERYVSNQAENAPPHLEYSSTYPGP